MPTENESARPLWQKILFFAVGYLACILLSRLVSIHHSPAVSIWLPAGLYVATLLMVPAGDWAALIVAASAVDVALNLQRGLAPSLSLWLCVANGATAVVGASLFRRFVAQVPRLTSIRRLFGFLVCTAGAGAATGAAIGAWLVVGRGFNPSYADAGLRWWIANAMAILAVAPFVLTWFQPDESGDRWWTRLGRLAEAALLCAGLLAVSWQLLVRDAGIMSGNKSVLAPFILWATLRFGLRGASAISLLFALLVTYLTSRYLTGLTPEQASSGSYLFVLQVFLALSSFIALLPAVAIGERDAANRQLGRSEERFRAMVEESLEAITIHTDGRIVYANPAAARMFGAASASALVGVAMLDLVHPDSRPAVLARRKKLAETGQGGPMSELRYLALDGTPIDVEVQSVRLHYGGKPSTQITSRDIGRRKRAEDALKLSEYSMRESSVPTFWIGRDARILRVNRAACEMLGYSEEELLAMSIIDINPESSADRWAEHWLELRERRRMSFETGHRHRDGRVIPVEVDLNWFEFNGREYNFVYVRDISERRVAAEARANLEERLRQAQRLEAVGTLANGIAHDFNNILGGIYGFATLARTSAGGNAEQAGYLDEIARAGQRAAELVRQILAFSKTQGAAEALVPVQLGHVIAEAVSLLRVTVPRTIEFATSLPDGLPAVKGNAAQLHQVIMNLCTNAGHAMRNQPGTLGISLEACVADEALAEMIPGTATGTFVRMTVTDTGCGMDEATRQRVFEPFFTTKPPGEGSGLGLSVVHGIVRSHGGAIRISSAVGSGTRIDVYLPAASAPSQARSVPVAAALRGNGERILFVDDEEPIVKIGQISLTRLGYAVEGGRQVLEALALLERDPTAFDLVISDQTMPKMAGLEFALRIHALRKDLPVVLTSGYSLELTPERMKAAGVRELLSKPYTMEKLAEVVHRHVHRVLRTPAG